MKKWWKKVEGGTDVVHLENASAQQQMCLCLSATSRSSVETDERIEVVFGMGASFHLVGNSSELRQSVKC